MLSEEQTTNEPVKKEAIERTIDESVEKEETVVMAANQVWGNIPVFNHAEGEWDIFLKQLEQFFVLNDIDESKQTKKRAILINALHSSSFKLLMNLCHPVTPEKVDYKVLIQKLDQHFKPPQSSFSERRKFYEAQKDANQSILEWAALVRQLASGCDFNQDHVLNTALRDRFIMGLPKGAIKDKLFLEDVNVLTFDKAIQIAKTVECIQHQYDTMGTAEPGVYRMGTSKKKCKPATSGSSTASKKRCAVCGYTSHTDSECRYRSYRCKKCSQKGHLKRMCKSQKDQYRKPNHNFIDNNEISLYNFRSYSQIQPVTVDVSVSGIPITMEVDSGAPISALSSNLYQKHFQKCPLKNTAVSFASYNGGLIKPRGVCKLLVSYNNCRQYLDFYVFDNGGPPLLGRNWMHIFKVGLKQLNFVQNQVLTPLFQKFSDVFSGTLGEFNKGLIKLNLKCNYEPKFCKPRPLPLALKDRVEKEIEKLVRLGVLEPVDYSEWGTPIVPVLKKSGEVRICGDYKTTLNPFLKVEQYPLPRIEELFAKLHGGQEFSKIDLSMAYQQLVLDKSSRKLTTISTTKGLFQYTRLVFGLASAPAIFQKTMDSIFSGFQGVVVFMDDILVTAKNRELHHERLEAVLKRLQDCGLRVCKDKCTFFAKSVDYLGHTIDKEGLHPSKKIVEAILQAKAPTNVKELQSFLGLANYYRKFVPRVSQLCIPLYELLKKDVAFHWGSEEENSFKELKMEIASERVLAHYDPKIKVKLIVDASPCGVAAVLAHTYPTGVERPISFASRKLTPTEQKYAQIDREALAIVFGVKKYHQYLYGRRFVLVTDNKPLVSIFGPKKGIPIMAANRLQRYALLLSGYQFDIEYINTKDNVADYFSRNPENCPNDNKDEDNQDVFVNYVDQVNELPTTSADVRAATAVDAILTKVQGFVRNGWPEKVEDRFKPYFLRRTELSIENDCLFWGYRLIIPETLRQKMITEIHKTHLGICKMKSLARGYFWWPKLDFELEQVTKNCDSCMSYRSSPPKNELTPWNYPSEPWFRLHIDFMGKFCNKFFLLLVDATTKWVECIDMGSSITSSQTIHALRQIFARFGLPREIATDNGTSLVSKEFEDFLKLNGITHRTSPVGHAASNGQAENGVKNIKNALKRALHGKSVSELNKYLSMFLLDYRNCTHSTTGQSPAQLLLGRSLRNRFDLLKLKNVSSSTSVSNSVQNRVKEKQSSQKKYYSGRAKRSFEIGDTVFCKDFSVPGKTSWAKCSIIKKLGKSTYWVQAPGRTNLWKRHVDQINLAADSRKYLPECVWNHERITLPEEEQVQQPKSPRYKLRSRCIEKC